MKPKVYGFVNGHVESLVPGPGDCVAIAVAEDGTFLASHVSSSGYWARVDLDSPYHQAKYELKYPKGYEFVWLEPGANPEHLAIIQSLPEAE